MEGHEERGKELEFELAEMEERSDALADDVEGAKEDWASKQSDAVRPRRPAVRRGRRPQGRRVRRRGRVTARRRGPRRR